MMFDARRRLFGWWIRTTRCLAALRVVDDESIPPYNCVRHRRHRGKHRYGGPMHGVIIGGHRG